ncbi:MAG: DUF86 domain-containing protein [Planctomycetes bacterium]|nr:DUF86 domain-containing protein [Planctomycetota bacterium]
MADNARRAQELCAANTLPEILADWQKRAAFERVMEVLGEAVKRLPRELTARYAAVDWRGIAGMRDRVSHGYDAIDYDVLWHAVQRNVPGLLATVDRMLKDVEEGSSNGNTRA